MFDGWIDRSGHVWHEGGAVLDGALPPTAGEDAVDRRLIEAELDDARRIAPDDGEVWDIFGDDRASGDDSADADAVAAGSDDGASAEPRVVADFQLTELHRVFFDESEMAIEEKRVRRKAIERVVAEQDQHTGRDGDVAADGDSCGK